MSINAMSVWDCVTETSFLVDTGADVCVFLASPKDKRERFPQISLTAANGSEINTWGHRKFTFTLGRGRHYKQILYLADVTRPILGTKFFTTNNIAIDLCGRRLFDLNHGDSYPAQLALYPSNHCGLLVSSPSPFSNLLFEFPQIVAPSLQDQMSKHGVEHYIVTNGPPVYSRP